VSGSPNGVRRLVRLYRDAYSGLPRDLWLLSLFLFVNRSGSMVLPLAWAALALSRALATSPNGDGAAGGRAP